MVSPKSTEATSILLGKVRDGDTEAREVLLARYLPVLQRWARGRLPSYARDSADTDDIVQVSLLRAVNRLQDFESQREGAFLAYLRRIVLNAIRDEIRSTGRRPRFETEPDRIQESRPSALEEAIGGQMMERYEAALMELDEIQREAVILRLEFGYSHVEVAEAIGSPSANAARMMVSRSLVKLAEAMGATG